jgi:hypothetical protein
MTESADELKRLRKLYPEMVTTLTLAGYSLRECQYPEGFATTQYGEVAHKRHIFSKMVSDTETPPRFSPFQVNAAISDTRHHPVDFGVTAIFSVQLFVDEPINLYMEQKHNHTEVFPQEAEDAFVQCALLALKNREGWKQRRQAWLANQTKPT